MINYPLFRRQKIKCQHILNFSPVFSEWLCWNEHPFWMLHIKLNTKLFSSDSFFSHCWWQLWQNIFNNMLFSLIRYGNENKYTIRRINESLRPIKSSKVYFFFLKFFYMKSIDHIDFFSSFHLFDYIVS